VALADSACHVGHSCTSVHQFLYGMLVNEIFFGGSVTFSFVKSIRTELVANSGCGVGPTLTE
jgi:hypothetical protein